MATSNRRFALAGVALATMIVAVAGAATQTTGWFRPSSVSQVTVTSNPGMSEWPWLGPLNLIDSNGGTNGWVRINNTEHLSNILRLDFDLAAEGVPVGVWEPTIEFVLEDLQEAEDMYGGCCLGYTEQLLRLFSGGTPLGESLIGLGSKMSNVIPQLSPVDDSYTVTGLSGADVLADFNLRYQVESDNNPYFIGLCQMSGVQMRVTYDDCETVSCEGVEKITDTAWECCGKEIADPDWTPDRRPVYRIGLEGGGYGGGPLPLSRPEMRLCDDVCPDPKGNGVPDAFDWLLGELNRAYDEGWRRFILWSPTGNWHNGTAAQNFIPSSQWWTMPEWMKQAYITHVGAWITNHSDATVGIYIGWRLHEPCDLRNDPDLAEDEGVIEAYLPSCKSDLDATRMAQNLVPWIDDVGITEVWFDGIDPWDAEDFICFTDSGKYSGVQLGMEPAPFDHTTGGTCGEQSPLSGVMDRARYMSSLYYYEEPCVGGVTRLSRGINPATTSLWDFSASTGSTEIHVEFDQQWFSLTDTPQQIFNKAKAYHAKGFMIWSGAHLKADGLGNCVDMGITDAAKRIYWPGAWGGVTLLDLNLRCPYDLDMDDDVDNADLAIVTGNVSMATGRRLMDGDVDGDGVVTSIDVGLVSMNVPSSCPSATVSCPPECPCPEACP